MPLVQWPGSHYLEVAGMGVGSTSSTLPMSTAPALTAMVMTTQTKYILWEPSNFDGGLLWLLNAVSVYLWAVVATSTAWIVHETCHDGIHPFYSVSFCTFFQAFLPAPSKSFNGLRCSGWFCPIHSLRCAHSPQPDIITFPSAFYVTAALRWQRYTSGRPPQPQAMAAS